MSTQAPAVGNSAPPRLALVAIIILLIAGLSLLDKVLAHAQEQELQQTAQNAYREASDFEAPKMDEAIDAFRKAHSLQRQNREFGLKLADTLIADDKLDEAQRLLQDVLERDSNDGQANLLNAHLMAKRDLPVEAESFYHRAIYGEWPGEAADARLRTRLELIDFLATQPERKNLLAELLALPEGMKNTPDMQEHLARLFLSAGSPARAIDQYRSLIGESPSDAAAYTGLGNAELEMGEFGKARDAFLAASKAKPGDAEISGKLDLTMTLASLDPTSRRLTSIEKYRRSLEILRLARISLGNCRGNQPAQDDELLKLRSLLDQALISKPRTGIANETAEEVLSLAEKAWQERIKVCGEATSPDEQPLRLIMGRLSH